MRPLLAMASLLCVSLLQAESLPADVTLCVEGNVPGAANDLMAKINAARALDMPGAVIEIRISRGEYTRPAWMAGAFELISPCAADEICLGNKTLRLQGGFQENTGCSIRNSRLLETAILSDGFGLQLGGDFNIELDGVSIQLQGPTAIDVRRCRNCSASNSVRISDSQVGGAFWDLNIYAGSVELLNNWVSSTSLHIGSPGQPAHTVELGFNTLEDMATLAVDVVSRERRARIHHNVVAHRNHDAALSMRFDVVPGNEPLMQHNALAAFVVLHGNTVLGAAVGSLGNIMTNDIGFGPQIGTTLNPRLREVPPSLAVNAGMTPTALLAAGIESPRGDVVLAIHPRFVGSRYDLGAFESSIDDDPDRLHFSGFE